MAASTELTILEGEVYALSGYLGDTAEFLDDVSETLDDVKDILELPEDVQKMANRLENIAKQGGTIANVFSKIGLLKPIARPFGEILFDVSDVVKKVEAKAKSLEIKFKPYKEKVEKAKEEVDKRKKALEEASEQVEDLGDDINSANSRLDAADDFVKSFPGALPALVSSLNTGFTVVDGAASVANAALEPINDGFNSIRQTAEELKDLVSIPEFQSLVEFKNQLDDIAGEFEFLQAPLAAVYDAAGPILDALSSIFGFFLAPLEAVLEAVLKATGIQDVVEEAKDYIRGLLPNADILDGIGDAITNALDTQFTDIFDVRLISPLDGLLDDITIGPFLPSLFGEPSAGDDVIIANFASPPNFNFFAGDGNDIMVGNDGRNIFVGGAGADIFIGGGGDDLILGGTSVGDRDTVIYSGFINDYSIVSRLDSNGLATGIWEITDFSTNRSINDGADVLEDVEDIVFADATVPIGDISTFIRTRSLDGEIKFVNSFALGESNVQELDGTVLFSTEETDWMFGGAGLDILFGSGGNDQITSAVNGNLTISTNVLNAPGDQLNGGDGNDAFIVGVGVDGRDVIDGGNGTDSVIYAKIFNSISVFLATGVEGAIYRPTSITLDADAIGKQSVGASFADEPIRIFARIQDVENISGSGQGDFFWGTDGDNILDGFNGDDQLRGLGGDDILYGGNGNDVLNGDRGNDILFGGTGVNQFIGSAGTDEHQGLKGDEATNILIYGLSPSVDLDSIKINLVDFETTGYAGTNNDLPSRIVAQTNAFTDEWEIAKFNSNGIETGRDTAFYIDRLVGTEGDDQITVADGESQIIYGAGGNDTLIGSRGVFNGTAFSDGSTLYGGAGNDTLISGRGSDRLFGEEGDDTVLIIGDANLENDVIFGDGENQNYEGTDTLDFSQSDYSWQLYLNIASGNGTATGKFALSAANATDLKYIQPTLGVNGVVEKPLGSSSPGEVYPGVNFELRVPDANTPEPGGRTTVSDFEVFLGSQNRDIFAVGSHLGAITVHGNGGDDVLFGGQQFADQLFGGAGDDVLGTYNQTFGLTDEGSQLNFFDANVVALLDGGAGNDIFVAGDFREDFVGGAGIDEVTYESGAGGVSVNLATGAISGGYAEGDSITGIENLTGSEFADVLTGSSETNLIVGWSGDDVIDGGDGADVLYGNDGDDTLLGGDGNDTLHGGAGTDILNGGAGNDTASWSQFQVHPKGGTDSIIGGAAPVIADLATGQAGAETLIGIENLTGGLANDILSGDASNNVLAGDQGDDILTGRDGDDVLLGGLGDDILIGGNGNDWFSGGGGINTIDGGEGTDILDFSLFEYGITIVMDEGSQTSGSVSSFIGLDWAVWTDSLTMIQDPLGAPGDMIASGTDETLFTFELFEFDPNDPNDDLLVPRAEITPDRLFRLDPVFADTPEDLIEPIFLPDDDLLPEQEFTVLRRFEATVDNFTSIEIFAGSEGNDRMIGNSLSTVFHGGQGADEIDGGAGMDTASYVASEERVVVRLFDGTALGGDAEGDTLSNIENLVGSAHNDVLVGTSGDNTLEGGDGNDTIRGNAGNDTLLGGTGNDTLDGGSGNDTVSYDGAAGRVVVRLNLAEDVGSGEGVDTFISIENVTGSDFNDRLVGDAEDNILIGGFGDDILAGLAGNDTLYGGNGNDDLTGAGGDDILIGGFGSDRMFGLGGADTFDGGGGNDWIEGGLGVDLIEGGGGDDDIFGFFGADTINGGVGNDNIRADGAGDIVNGGNGNDRLVGANGQDVLWGGSGNDILFGGGGLGNGDGIRDVFVFKSAANGGGGFDIIRDFEDTTDKIDLSESGYTDFADVFADARQVGKHIEINFDFSGLLRIDNFVLADLTPGDFIF